LEAERVTSRTFELFPGGQYSTAKQRNDLNEIATIQNSVTEAVARTGRSQRQLEIASIGTAKSTAQRVQISTTQNKIDEQSVAIARARNLELAKELGIEVDIGKAAANKNKARGGGLGKGAAGALSNAAVGGAFPLLFGQSGAAAAGGAIGGIAGSLIPGIGGFGGSLIGTILGEKLGQGNQVKQLGEDIGFSAEQTKMLGVAFQQAGRDFDKFQQSVSTIQGLSLSIEDQAKAIQLASSLTESYGGKVDKVTDAFAKALSTGKVTQGTLDQLTRQNIEIQQALADKYKISRSELLTYAKEGKISVQDLIDTLVEIGNKGQASAVQQSTAFETAYKKIETAVNNLKPIFESLFKFISDQLSNTFDEVSNTLTNILTGIETFANVVGPVFQQLSLTISRSLASIKIPPWLASFTRETATSTLLNAVPGGAGLNFLRQVGKDTRQNATKGRYTTPDQQTEPKDRLDSFSVLGQLPPSGGSSGAADKAAKAAEREAARVANIVRDQAALTQQKQLQAQYSQALFTAEVAKDEVLKIQLQRELEIGKISLQYSKHLVMLSRV
jgi:tape measure domain-containing protein